MFAISSVRWSARRLICPGSCLRRIQNQSNRYLARRVVKPYSARQIAASAVVTMEKDIEGMVQRVHSTSTKAVLYVTGGAVTALSWLISVPGASRTVLEAVVPYASTSSDQLLQGQQADSYSGLNQAKSLAKAAYRKATALTLPGESDFVGIAAVCALATDREKKGAQALTS